MPSLSTLSYRCPACGKIPDKLKRKPFWGKTTHVCLKCDCGFLGPWAEVEQYRNYYHTAQLAFDKKYGKRPSTPPPPLPTKM